MKKIIGIIIAIALIAVIGIGAGYYFTNRGSTAAAAISETEAQNTTTGPQAAGEITADEAKSIALQHAGLAEADVLYANVEYDRDNGHNEWSVDFATQDTEYDYEINAADGSILKSEKEAHTR